MIYYVSASASDGGTGSAERPFRKISEAAKIAKAGDEVQVLPGVYREAVNPVHAGREDARITYRSTEPLGAVITGAEPIKNWTQYQDEVWMSKIPNGFFGSYNPYTTEIFGDWYYPVNPVHTGEVYLNGRSMYECHALEGVTKPERDDTSWEPEFSVYKWYTCQEDGCTLIYANFHGVNPNQENVEINVRRTCFHPDKTGVNYITLSGFVVKQAATNWAPPTAYQEGMIGPHWSKGWIIEDCEVSDSRCSGISLGKYLQPENDNKWSIGRLKHGTQTERDAICQAQLEGWTKENIGSHIVRRCEIHHCEQTGIMGHLGGVFSLIEDNHIHHINNKQQLAGAEIGGIKMHAAIDVIYRRNHIHHCTRGIWLDWQAQGTRVTQNLLHHNMPPKGTKITSGMALGEDIFMEVSHGPTLIDNNILLSTYSIRMSAQGVACVHNIIAGPFTSVGGGTDNSGTSAPRYTPYHLPHRTEIAGFMTFLHGDNRFYNNVFVQNKVPQELVDLKDVFSSCDGIEVTGTKPFDGYPTEAEYRAKFFVEGDDGAREDRNKYYTKLPIYTGGNVYVNGAKPCDKELNYKMIEGKEVYLDIRESDDGWRLDTNLYEQIPEFETGIISTTLLGEAFEPEQLFENPDGTEIIFREDYFGEARGVNPLSGPFASAASAGRMMK